MNQQDNRFYRQLSGSRPKCSAETDVTHALSVRTGAASLQDHISRLKWDLDRFAVRRFNALVGHFDLTTLYHYDRVDPDSILCWMQGAYGAGATLTQEFERAGRELGYFQ